MILIDKKNPSINVMVELVHIYLFIFFFRGIETVLMIQNVLLIDAFLHKFDGQDNLNS